MLKTILIVILSSAISGACVYAVIKSTQTPPQALKEPQNTKNTLEKTYTDKEVQNKIRYEKERQKITLQWRDLITCEKSGGQYLGIAGGFENVNIRIKNNTDYKLDNVTVGVFLYNGISENKQCHYEPVMIENIPPNAEKSIQYTYVQCGQRLSAIIQALNIESLNLNIGTEIE